MMISPLFTNKKATSWIEYAEYKESGTFPTWGGYPKIARANVDLVINGHTHLDYREKPDS